MEQEAADFRDVVEGVSVDLKILIIFMNLSDDI